MTWLQPHSRRNISELERHLIETYNVVFLSRESYYQLLRSSHLTWQKGNRENPRKNPEKVKEINENIAKILKVSQTDIESGKLAVYALDECHLQGDDICSYLWGERQNREIIKVINERDRQTYYGALNLWTQEFIVSPYSTGNGENTVKFLQEIKKRYPGQRLLLIWDGASYHRGEEMKKLLAIENAEKIPEEWSITCQLFAPYAPAENPVEGIWGSWQLLVIGTNGEERSHQTHIVPAEAALLANEVHPCDFKSSDRNTPCLRALPPESL